MPQVVQIQRAPNSWEQAGQTVQQTTDNFLKSMLAMGQMQNNNAWRMAEMNMQNQRLADANARQDKQLAAIDARSEKEMAQRLQMHNDTMSLHRAQLARANEAMNKSQLVTVKGPDGSDMPVLFNPLTQKVTPFSMPGMGGGTGGAMGGGSSIPGLDAATSAGMNEVLSPGWSPTAGGGQNGGPSLAELGVRAGIFPAPQNDNTQSPANGMQGATFAPQADTRPASQLTLAELGQRAGILPSPQDNQQLGQQPAQAKPASQLSTYELGQRAGIFPGQQPQVAASTLAPGTVVDGSGKPVQVPDNYAWGKQEKQYVNGVEYYGARTPNGVYFKVGGPVPPTPQDQKLINANQKELMAERQGLENVQKYGSETLNAIQAAKGLIGQYGPLVAGVGASNIAPSWNQPHQNLKNYFDVIGGSLLADSIKALREASPNGTLGIRLTEKEIMKEIQRFGVLKENSSPSVLLDSLNRIEKMYSTMMEDAQKVQIAKGYVQPEQQQEGKNTVQRFKYNPDSGRLE